MLRFALCFVLLAGFCSSSLSQSSAQECVGDQCAVKSRGIQARVQARRAARQESYGQVAYASANGYGSVGSAGYSTGYGSVGSSAYVTNYGSTGSQVTSYGSTGSLATVRSSTCTCVNCQCGQVANQAAAVMSSDSVSSLGFKSRKASREVILAAAKTACDECTITPAEYQAIRMAIKSPRMLARIEDMILAQAQASGAYSFALDANGDPIKSAINWEAIGDFILKIAPIIFKLIEMFAVMEKAGDIQGMAMILDHFDYLSTLHWQSQLAC